MTKDEIAKFKDAHRPEKPLQKEEIEMVFVTLDTMDDYQRYLVGALDIYDNVWLIDAGECDFIDIDDNKRATYNEARRKEGKQDVLTSGDVLNRKYYDIEPKICLIDAGGHRQREVQDFCRKYPSAFMQKGTSMVQKMWYKSENVAKLFMVNAKSFQAMALYYMYAQKDKTGNFLFISDDIEDVYIEELKDIKPNDSAKWRRQI